jgi:hypothetical protein
MGQKSETLKWNRKICSIASGLPTLEHATYNFPCEKQSVCRCKPHNLKDWPCNVTMQSEPLKWNREIGNLKIVNGSKIGNIEMKS